MLRESVIASMLEAGEWVGTCENGRQARATLARPAGRFSKPAAYPVPWSLHLQTPSGTGARGGPLARHVGMRIIFPVMAKKPNTIDEYLAVLSLEQRDELEKLRQIIHKILPKAEECLSYGIPAFRLDGRIVAGFAATAKGFSYLPFSGSTLGTLASELEGYAKTKSALHFTADKPLPSALVRKLLRARAAEGKC
jgi:uncharacterized protein YdhG (YjbR/CyaY superfamily)